MKRMETKERKKMKGGGSNILNSRIRRRVYRNIICCRHSMVCDMVNDVLWMFCVVA